MRITLCLGGAQGKRTLLRLPGLEPVQSNGSRPQRKIYTYRKQISLTIPSPITKSEYKSSGAKDMQKDTTGEIPRWSPTLVLVARFSAYVWQSGRDAQFSLTYGRMCLIAKELVIERVVLWRLARHRSRSRLSVHVMLPRLPQRRFLGPRRRGLAR
jgi:hypothetical protein